MILYADAQAAKELARVDCASNATFTILSEANEAGVIGVNVCPEHVGRIRTLTATSAQAFDAMLAQVQKGTEPMPADKLRALGWYRERSALPGGGELHYLSVVAVGHGVAILPTVVLLTSTQAVVVQTESMRLCRLTDANPGPSPFALCADPKGTLSAIAQRLLSPGR